MKKSIGAKTLIYPTPTWIVGTYDKDGTPNVATVAWGGICCSKPSSIAISLRKATYSYGNIVERKAFTVGEILDVKADEDVLGDKGRPAIEKVRPFLFAPGERTYHGIGPCLGKAFSIGKGL